jgi:hypothetical protein
MSNIIDLGGDDKLKSVNFGDGIELLMNNKIKEKSSSSYNDLDLEDLNSFENNLNDIMDDKYDNNDNFFSRTASPMSEIKFDNIGDSFNVKFDDLGKETAKTEPENKTWDGYQKYNSIPINTDKSPPPVQSKEDALKEKYKYLKQLEALEKKGITLTKQYSIESPLIEMKAEYDSIMEEKQISNSIKFQSNILMTCVNGIEFLNNKINPFDINLDGWSDQVNDNINDYDEIFRELHEKYKNKPSIAPELKLLFQLGGSAAMVHMTNTMFKTAVPGIDDIFRQNPDLMQHFKTATVNSMNQSNPGFAGFMNNFVGGNNSSNTPANQPPSSNSNTYPYPQSNNPPPPPISTKDYNNFNYDSSNRPGNNSSIKRNEMRGPSDISDILSNLRTRPANPLPSNSLPQQSQPRQSQREINESSIISITDMKELQSSGNIPKRSKRRGASDKNTISLDL